ncbi:hypothetical protein Pmar_PMAR005499, partial [Perkinsus marinus ATCC 50983]
MARKRGLASIKATTGERMEMFHRALDGYISKGFCAIVKDNRLDPSKPEASTCQSIWEKLSKGTPYQGAAPNMLDSVVDDTIDEIYDLSQLAAEIDGDTFEVAVKSIDPGRIKS